MTCSYSARAAALLLLTVAAAGCRDSTGPGQGPDGIRFSYSSPAGQNLNFRAQGAPTFVGGAPQHGTWAGAGWGATSRDIAVLALQAGSGRRGDLFFLDAYDIRGPERDLRIDGDRVYVEVSRNFDIETLESDHYCVIWSGTVHVSEISDIRLRGSFSGEGVCYDDRDVEVGVLSVSNGTFDVPVIVEFSEVLN